MYTYCGVEKEGHSRMAGLVPMFYITSEFSYTESYVYS